jgi:hypothetical protein
VLIKLNELNTMPANFNNARPSLISNT